MASFISSDVDFYQAADISIHGGMTRVLLQDNLTHCYEQSGYDLDTPPINATAISYSAGISWGWVTDYFPHAIPIYPKQGSGYRTYTIGLHVYSAVAGNLKVYLTQHPTSYPIDAYTGAVEGFTSWGDYIVASGVESYVEDTITIDLTNYKNFSIGTDVIPMQFVFPQIAGNRNSAGTIEIHGMRIRELY